MILQKLYDTAQKAIVDRAFPGGVIVSGTDKGIDLELSFGRYTYEIDSPEVKLNHYFDLASLTKVVVTTPCIMQLISDKKLNLDDKISKFLPMSWFATNDLKCDIEIIDLLAHCSGLSACVSPELILNPSLTLENRWSLIKNLPLAYKRRTDTIYSDIGFITLGKIIEYVSEMSLDQFAQQIIFEPLQMENTCFNPNYPKNKTIPTEYTSDGILLNGVVHDECARALGGVCGHAGVFSTVHDVAKYAKLWLNPVSSTLGWVNQQLVAQFRQLAGLVSDSTRALGWNTVSLAHKSYTINAQYSAGNYIENSGFGHTGFVGNSLWISPKYNRYVILLTNQVFPRRNETDIKIKQYWRNQLNNVVWEATGHTEYNNLPLMFRD